MIPNIHKRYQWYQYAYLLRDGMTDRQLEAVRRVGARGRHEARVAAAREHIDRATGIMHGSPTLEWAADAHEEHRALVRRAVMAAFARAARQAGMPGSASGTSEPALFRGFPASGAWVAAYVQAAENSSWPQEIFACPDPDHEPTRAMDPRPAAGWIALCHGAKGCTVAWWPYYSATRSLDEADVVADHLVAGYVEAAAWRLHHWAEARIIGADTNTPRPDAPLDESVEWLEGRRITGDF